MAKVAVELYKKASDHARSRGIILADTKFEFGMVPTSSLPPSSKLVQRQPRFKNKDSGEDETMILVDEVLTPDSSRFWSAAEYSVGKGQASFDKQFVRDYLETLDWDKTPPGPDLPNDIVQKTSEKYIEAYTQITGLDF